MWPRRSHTEQAHWEFLLKTTWMTLLSSFIGCSAESFIIYFIFCIFLSVFSQVCPQADFIIRSREIQDSQECCLYGSPTPPPAVPQMSSAVYGHHYSSGSHTSLGCIVLGSCSKYFLHHHTLGNADEKREAAGFSLGCVICQADFTGVFSGM